MPNKPTYEEMEQRVRELEKVTNQGKIAKEDLNVRLRFEILLSDLSATFVNLPADKIDEEIEQGLRRIVEFLGFDRSSVFQRSQDESKYRLTHSWAVDGVEPQKINVPEKEIPWVDKTLREHKEVVVISNLDDLPPEAARDKAFFKKRGPVSLIAIPLIVGGNLIGTVAFGMFRREISFSDEMVKRIKIIGDIFANALIRGEADKTLNKAFSEIKQLKEQLQAECTYLRSEINLEHNFEEIIGESSELRYALYKIEQVASTDATVLIQGETGTGKELVARAIHHTSRRKNRPLLKVDCGTLPSNLIESELFGYEKGAFTGAQSRFTGRFEIADGATIFLDEIGELPLELQAKLLRVIQEGTFERLGSSRTIQVDVRVIAATNRVLEDEIKSGRFREDLYYRLNVFPITVPPLRQRQDDIPLLLNAFINKFNKKMGKRIERVTNETINALKKYHWPGNVRELQNMVERAVIVSDGDVLELETPESKNLISSTELNLKGNERAHILRVLGKTHWKITGKGGAAELLQINSSTLRSRMKKLDITRPGSQSH